MAHGEILGLMRLSKAQADLWVELPLHQIIWPPLLGCNGVCCWQARQYPLLACHRCIRNVVQPYCSGHLPTMAWLLPKRCLHGECQSCWSKPENDLKFLSAVSVLQAKQICWTALLYIAKVLAAGCRHVHDMSTKF